MPATNQQRIIAFYGYKGGVGRSLLAANISVVLSLIGKRVLLIDWDLEAPGIGDYFDSATESIPQMWRTHCGLFELLAECRSKPEGSDLYETICRFLRSADVRKPILPIKFVNYLSSGSLDLMGPGRQIGQEFAAALMTADWVDFFVAHADNFHRAFRKAVFETENPYDFVIIDTRTGYNLSTLFVLRLMADLVYFVAPKTNQALLGIANVWKLLPTLLSATGEKESGAWSPPEQHLVLSRYHEQDSPQDPALNYVKKYFGDDEPAYMFPSLEGITDHEQLFLQSRELRPIFFPDERISLPPIGRNVSAYRNAFWRMCSDIGGVDPGKFAWKSVVLELSDVQSELVPAQLPSLDQGSAFAMSYLESADDSSELNALKSLDTWAGRAALLDRATLSELFANYHKLSFVNCDNRKWDYKVSKLPADLKARLLLDAPPNPLEAANVSSNLEVGADSANTEAPVMRTAGPGERSSTPTTIIQAGSQPHARQRATRLWKAATLARDQDNPAAAAEQLKNAIALLDDAMGHSLPEATKREIVNDIAIYEWNLCSILQELGEWEESYRRLVNLLDDPGMPASREQRDQRTVSQFDISQLAIELFDTRLRETGLPLPPREADRAARATALLRKSLQPASVLDQLALEERLESFELTNLAVSALRDEAAILEQLTKVAELRDDYAALINSFGVHEYRLAVLTNCLNAYAMICRLSGNGKASDRIAALSIESRSIIDKWFSGSGTVPTSAPDQTQGFAGTLLGIGRESEAFFALQDTLQLVGGISDGRSEKSRIEAVLTIGLLESSLGRADLAARTWSDIAELAAKSDFPPLSQRRRRVGQMNWWVQTEAFYLGRYDVAWNDLKESELGYRKILNSANSSATERAGARTALQGITGFLAETALNIGRLQDAVSASREWEGALKRVYYLENDAGRRLAGCLRTRAEAAFCLGDVSGALAAVEEGLRHNRFGSDAFGGIYSVTQDRLVLIGNEIRAFSSGMIVEADVAAALARLEDSCTKMLNDTVREGWHITDVMSIAVTFARAAATALRINDRERAQRLANDVLTRWLAFVPQFGRDGDEGTRWVAELARLPQTIANAVLAEGGIPSERGVHKQAATDGLKQLPIGLKQRYGHIFALCGLAID